MCFVFVVVPAIRTKDLLFVNHFRGGEVSKKLEPVQLSSVSRFARPRHDRDARSFAMRDASYMDTLDALARIRDVCQGELSLPQLCVVGDQSSGKSSLLQCITGVDFPVKSGICTRVPTLVECRRSETESCELNVGGGAFTDVAVNGIAVAIAKAQLRACSVMKRLGARRSRWPAAVGPDAR